MTTKELDDLIEKLTSESRDLAIQEVLSIVNNPSLKKDKLIYRMVKEIAESAKKTGLNTANDMQIAILEAYKQKLC